MDPTYDHAYSSIGELKGASPLIVVGTVTVQTTVLNRHQVPSTISNVMVERTLKGTASTGQLLGVKQYGGQTENGSRWEMEGFPLLRSGTRYLLFLIPANLQAMPGVYYPVGAPQGVYPVDTSGAVNSLSPEAAKMGIAIHQMALDAFVQQVQASN